MGEVPTGAIRVYGLAPILRTGHSEPGLLEQVQIGEMWSLKAHLKMSFFRSYTETSNLRTSWSPILELSNCVILDLLGHWRPLVKFTRITWRPGGIALLNCWLGILDMASKEPQNVAFSLPLSRGPRVTTVVDGGQEACGQLYPDQWLFLAAASWWLMGDSSWTGERPAGRLGGF